MTRAALMLIFAIAALAVFAFGGLAAAQSTDDAADHAELEQRLRLQPDAYPSEAAAAHLRTLRTHHTGYLTAGVGGALMIVLCVGLVGGLLTRRRRLVTFAAGAMLGVGALSIWACPMFEMGIYGPAPPRVLAQLYAVPAGVAAIAGWLLARP